MCNCDFSYRASSPKNALSRRKALRLMACAAVAPALAGCERIAPFVVSDETVEQLGLETWSRLQQRMPVSRDAGAQRQVAEIATRLLVAAGEDPRRWEVQVFAQPEANAFVLPGRKIGVLEGMIRVAENESQLAAVIGHEIGHLQAEHSRERVSGETLRQWGLQLISFLLQVNDVAFAREIAALLGVGVEFGLVRPYGRAQELEADRLGLFTMAKAGYDPREAAELWRRMDERGGGTPALLSTHPAPQDRIEAIEALIPQAIEAARA
ncbi:MULTISPECIES: M48 family metallopeptidase [Microvirga]|uniref:M48 family metallopeptidase n=1 Tax=Microvirga TaxID=186650 RepID=UPI001CFFDEF3|nr:M48 family metallopeptidase [Microvirga lenta]MCB5176332.1 M48 family metallopeptidase [Microvirga lenta]